MYPVPMFSEADAVEPAREFIYDIMRIVRESGPNLSQNLYSLVAAFFYLKTQPGDG